MSKEKKTKSLRFILVVHSRENHYYCFNSRLQKELLDIIMDPPENVTATPKQDNIYEWDATIKGILFIHFYM